MPAKEKLSFNGWVDDDYRKSISLTRRNSSSHCIAHPHSALVAAFLLLFLCPTLSYYDISSSVDMVVLESDRIADLQDVGWMMAKEWEVYGSLITDLPYNLGAFARPNVYVHVHS